VNLPGPAVAVVSRVPNLLRRVVPASDEGKCSEEQGLTLVPISAQLELTLPLSAQLKITSFPAQPKSNRGRGPKVLKLSSNGSDVIPKVLKLSFEGSECKPLPRSTQTMAPHMEVTMTRRAAWERRRWPPPRAAATMRAAAAIAASIVACGGAHRARFVVVTREINRRSRTRVIFQSHITRV